MTNRMPFAALAFMIAVLLLGCPMPTIPPGGSGGSLTIQVGNHINSLRQRHRSRRGDLLPDNNRWLGDGQQLGIR